MSKTEPFTIDIDATRAALRAIRAIRDEQQRQIIANTPAVAAKDMPTGSMVIHNAVAYIKMPSGMWSGAGTVETHTNDQIDELINSEIGAITSIVQ